jgi:hypothetical protein
MYDQFWLELADSFFQQSGAAVSDRGGRRCRAAFGLVCLCAMCAASSCFRLAACHWLYVSLSFCHVHPPACLLGAVLPSLPCPSPRLVNSPKPLSPPHTAGLDAAVSAVMSRLLAERPPAPRLSLSQAPPYRCCSSAAAVFTRAPPFAPCLPIFIVGKGRLWCCVICMVLNGWNLPSICL